MAAGSWHPDTRNQHLCVSWHSLQAAPLISAQDLCSSKLCFQVCAEGEGKSPHRLWGRLSEWSPASSWENCNPTGGAELQASRKGDSCNWIHLLRGPGSHAHGWSDRLALKRGWPHTPSLMVLPAFVLAPSSRMALWVLRGLLRGLS